MGIGGPDLSGDGAHTSNVTRAIGITSPISTARRSPRIHRPRQRLCRSAATLTVTIELERTGNQVESRDRRRSGTTVSLGWTGVTKPTSWCRQLLAIFKEFERTGRFRVSQAPRRWRHERSESPVEPSNAARVMAMSSA